MSGKPAFFRLLPNDYENDIALARHLFPHRLLGGLVGTLLGSQTSLKEGGLAQDAQFLCVDKQNKLDALKNVRRVSSTCGIVCL